MQPAFDYFPTPRSYQQEVLQEMFESPELLNEGLPSFEYLAFIAVVAFVGTINPSTGDIGVLVPLEHSMLAGHASNEERTRTFARYSLIGALSMAAGALAAGLADIFVAWGFTKPAAFKLMFYLYAALGIGAALLYRRLPHARAEPSRPHAPLGPTNSSPRCRVATTTNYWSGVVLSRPGSVNSSPWREPSALATPSSAAT